MNNIKTSAANLFNLVNLNILGSRFFMGIVNILGDWSGNTIFAYPDMAVNLTNGSGQVMVGEITEYTLFYKNQGHDEANNVRVEFELPPGLSFLSDSSGLTPDISGKTYSWFLGTLDVGEEGAFTIQVQINSDFSFEEPLTFWSKIIPQAQAAENEKEDEVVVTASIGTDDPESDLSNNNSSVKILVYLPLISSQPESGKGEVDQRQPVLEISAWNNVGEFVYPGDTVTFEISVKNTGEVPSYNTRLNQELFNEVPGGFGTAEFELGTIEPGKSGKLSFGLKLADDGVFPAGAYYTVARATGHAPNGNEVSSNEARTNFEIKVKNFTSLLGATGNFTNELLQILFIIGCVCGSAGLKLFLPAKKLV
jgi:uncharacterized repeat protein (TIGR01451 family)